MTRLLLVGLKPNAVDYSDPALPPGMNAEKIQAAIDLGMEEINRRGWQGESCLVEHDETAPLDVERRLRASHYDCVVIGAGVRLPPKNLTLFEQIVNVVRRTAPQTAIAFNTTPLDSADSAARWLGSDAPR